MMNGTRSLHFGFNSRSAYRDSMSKMSDQGSLLLQGLEFLVVVVEKVLDPR